MAAPQASMMRPVDAEAAGREIRAIGEDPDAVVERRLSALLRRSADTEFGRRHGFASIGSLAEYQARVPPSRYEDLRGTIARIVEDDARDLLFPGRTTFFARTSGTSGEAKLFPYPEDETSFAAIRIGTLIAGFESAHPGCGQAALVFHGHAEEDATTRGVPIGSASGHILNLVEHPFFGTMPHAVWSIGDFNARYYVALRLAIPRTFRTISAFNPSTILMFFDKAVEFAPDLVRDLREGGISSELQLAPAVRDAIAPHLGPAPEAAHRFERAVRQGRLEPREVWPSLDVLMVWKAGMCSYYLPDLAARAPGCAIFSKVYSASEGIFAVPLKTEWVGGVPALMESVLEFHPAEASPDEGPFVPISRLEQGQEYRMLLTNHRGLYRYPIDDVVYVETWHERAPVIAFSHRFGNTSSLTGEKLTEPQIDAAMQTALSRGPYRPREFQVAPLWGSPPCYLVVVEFDGAEPGEAELGDLGRAFDEALAALNIEYASKRKSDRLGAPRLGLLRRGEFERMRRDRTAERGRSDAQVKIPRLVRDLVKVEDYAITRFAR